MSNLTVSRITVAVDRSAANGVLVCKDGALVAVLVHLEEDFYQNDRNRWHLEAGFGRCAGSDAVFDDLAAALRWIAKRLGVNEDCVAPALIAAGL